MSKQLSDGNPDGTVLGQSATDLVGFHGADPSAQHAVITNTSGTLGNANATINLILGLLQEKGLMAPS
jgi:hypothetical protein